MLKRFLIFVSFTVFISCANRDFPLFSFNLADYNYDYHNPNRRIDVNKTYLLNPTSIYCANGIKSQKKETINKYFKKKLKDNLKVKEQLKDKESKKLLPFLIPYEITIADLNFIDERTNFDFIILSKIEYLELLDKKKLDPNNKARLLSALSGAIATIKIIDLKNKDTLLEISCTVSVNNSKYQFSEVKEYQGSYIETIPIYKNSTSLGEKAMKKLLKKIK